MGQFNSTRCSSRCRQNPPVPSPSRKPPPVIIPAADPLDYLVTSTPGVPEFSVFTPDLAGDATVDLPDECLALIFHFLNSGDRKRCSLVCRRWLAVEGQSRQRISLDARADLLKVVPELFTRFDSVTKLALKCDRRSDSIGDEALELISSRCPMLTRLKLRACRAITEVGMVTLSKYCKNLRKLSCGSCSFGSRGIYAIVLSCPLLEELSVKRLRGMTDTADAIITPMNTSLKTICLKELYNGLCFGPLIAGSPKLKTLKLFKCTGDWDRMLEEIALKVPGLVELHLEKLQITDRGLYAFTACLQLEVLHLVKTPDCTDFGLSAVAGRCRLLRKLHIDGYKSNRIGDEGLSAVARSCAKLLELVLIGLSPTVLSVGLIAENCTHLERLALCACNTIGDVELSCIASKCIALKKLCIKGCPVSNQGMEALAGGCPNLVKVKVKKCRAVTVEGVGWLRANRDALTVNLDTESQPLAEQAEANASENGLHGNADEQFPPMMDDNLAPSIPSSSNRRSLCSKSKLRSIIARNFLASNVRKWFHFYSNEQQP